MGAIYVTGQNPKELKGGAVASKELGKLHAV